LIRRTGVDCPALALAETNSMAAADAARDTKQRRFKK